MTPAFERLRQEDSEFQASLGYLSQNKTNQTNKNYKEPKSAATTQYAQPEDQNISLVVFNDGSCEPQMPILTTVPSRG
jgi:hypothetical protein